MGFCFDQPNHLAECALTGETIELTLRQVRGLLSEDA